MITNQYMFIEKMAANAKRHVYQRKSPWAARLYEELKAKADPWLDKSDEEIRRLIPDQDAYYAYGLDVICPVDRTPLNRITWENPGHVQCKHGHVFPYAEYPDDGGGYFAQDGRPHYFKARWNGFVVTELTMLLKPLTYLYLITGDSAYANKAAVILDAIATIYPTAIHGPLDYPGLSKDKEGGRLERPYYQAARHLMLYGEAYSILQAYSELDQSSPTNMNFTFKENIKQNLIENAGDYCIRESRKDNYWPLHNGTADYNMGAMACGILCDIPEYVEWGLSGRSSIYNMLANVVDYDGSYYETSLTYSLATQSIYLRFAEMLYHYRSEKIPEGINLFDEDKFRAFFAEFKKKNSIAYRLPRYGDTDIDNVEWTEETSIYDAKDYMQLMMLAVRTKKESSRKEYRRLLGEMNITEEKLAQSGSWHALQWLLFHTEPQDFDLDYHTGSPLPADVLTGKGLVYLRYGEGAHARGLFMRYGATLNHGHLDELGLLLYDGGKEWSYDPGYYNTHYRFGWTTQTVSHITATINEKSQLRMPAAGGSLDFFGMDGVISCAQASDPAAYHSENALLYTRFLAHIPIDEEESYYIDIFHVEGGKIRDYSFHAKGTKFSTALRLQEPKPHELPAWSGYEWGRQVDGNYRLKGKTEEPFYWTPPGDGYRFFSNLQLADGTQDWQAIWEDEKQRRLRLHMLGEANRKIWVADGPDVMDNVKYILARDEGKQVSQYVSVIDTARERGSKQGDFPVRQVERMKLNRPSSTAVCFKVLLPDRTDYIYYDIEARKLSN